MRRKPPVGGKSTDLISIIEPPKVFRTARCLTAPQLLQVECTISLMIGTRPGMISMTVVSALTPSYVRSLLTRTPID